MISLENVCVRTCVLCVLRTHIDKRRHRGFSARLRKSHFVLVSNPLPGTRPADSTHIVIFFMFVKRGISMHMLKTQMLSACYHLFRHLSLPSETEFVNSLPTTSMETAHLVSQSHFEPIGLRSN